MGNINDEEWYKNEGFWYIFIWKVVDPWGVKAPAPPLPLGQYIQA